MFFTADLRSRVEGIDDNFFGNMSQYVVIGGEIHSNADVASLAKIIGDKLRDTIAVSPHTENISLSMCSSRYGLRYAPFDITDC